MVSIKNCGIYRIKRWDGVYDISYIMESLNMEKKKRNHTKGEKIKILVCGTRFGQMYARAICKLEEYELIGFLSRGSKQSMDCAAMFNVPLYTDINKLPDNIDLACVVIKAEVLGGESIDIAESLMKRRINVLIEQPIDYNSLVRCLHTAKKTDTFFSVSNFYKHLETTKSFQKAVGLISKEHKLKYINIEASFHIVFSIAHILATTLTASRPVSVEKNNSNVDNPFVALGGSIGNVPLNMSIYNSACMENTDNNIELFHRIVYGYDCGRLIFDESRETIEFQGKFHFPMDFYKNIDIYANSLKDNIYYSLEAREFITINEKIYSKWIDAISMEIKQFVSYLNYQHKHKYERDTQIILNVSQIWKSITGIVGFPRFVLDDYKEINKEILFEISKENLSDRKLEIKDLELETSQFVENNMKNIKHLSLKSMMYVFQNYGFFLNEEGTSLKKILEKLKVKYRSKRVIKRWISTLISNNYLLEMDDVLYSISPVITEKEIEYLWKEFKISSSAGFLTYKIADYFYENFVSLKALISEEKRAEEILFPKGRIDLACELYRKTAAATYMNKKIADIVVKKCIELNRNINILELGAGTGATTDCVLDAIKNSNIDLYIGEYTFSDVSDYFIQYAKNRYGNIKNINYKKIDIDKSLIKQGVSNKYDIVISMGAFNNCCVLANSFLNVNDILNENGFFLLGEITKEHPEILISQAFMMNIPNDDRLDSGRIFLDKVTIKNKLVHSNFKNVLCVPEDDSYLDCLGQTLFVCEKGNE